MRWNLLPVILAAGCNSIVGVHGVTLGGGADGAIDAPVVPDARVADAPIPDATAVDAAPPADAPICGDGICAPGEACAADCPVTGLVQTRYVGDKDTETLVPTDLSTTPVTAFVLDPSKGTFQAYPGTGNTDGTFTIPDVPFGEFYLNTGGTRFQVTSARYVDLTFAVLGRPNPAVDGAATIPLDMTNMTPWAPGDNIQLFANNCVAYDFYTPPLTTGTTNLVYTAPWGADNNPLVMASLGDTLDVWHQRTTTPMPGIQQTSLIDYYQTIVEMQSGKATPPVSGSFVQVAQSKTAHLQFPLDEWSAVGPFTAWPLAPAFVGVLVTDLPGTTKYGMLSGSDDLLDLLIDTSVISSGTVDFGTVSYGNPLDASLEVVLSNFGGGAIISADGADPMWPTQRGAFTRTFLPGGTQGLVHPIVGPVRDVTLDGQSLAVDQYDVPKDGATLAWTPPSVGSPDGYFVRLLVLTIGDGRGTQLAPGPSFATSGTQITIPPGYLTVDTEYVAQIQALQSAAPPSGFSTYITRLFRTGPKPTPCGGAGEACCTTLYNLCNDGLMCDGTNTCVACGGENEPCCNEDPTPCADESKDACNGSICAPCGGPGELCCDVNVCNGGGCCLGGACAAAGSCSSSCGADGQACCSGNSCTGADTTCDAASTMCVACGVSGLPCCDGWFCGQTSYCDNGTCP